MFNTGAFYPDLTLGQIRVRNWMIVLFLAGVGLVSRLPFQSTILHHWDSINFALALEKFDLYLHQPHPPGLFVFFILLGRLFDLFLHDANASMIWISIIASGLSVPAIFILGSTLFGQRVGLSSALLMLTSPLIWFHGEVALTYMLEFFWVLLLVLTCFAARSGNMKALFASALLLGLAGGVRPNTPIFMAPLWLAVAGWGLWERKYSIRNIVTALIVMGVGMLLWAIPLLVMSGGLLAYWEAFRWWQTQHLEDSGSTEGLVLYLARLVIFSLYGVGLGVIPVAWALCRDWRTLKHNLQFDWPTQTLTIWIAPALAYFIIIHLRQSGHIFTIMPALILIMAVSTVRVGQYVERFTQHGWVIILTLVVVGNGLFFLVGPANLFGSSRLIFSAPTWTTLREYDNFVTERVVAIRRNFAPEETVVLASSRNFRLPDFYLRDYQETALSYRLGEKVVTLPGHIRTFVLFDETALPQLSAHTDIRYLSLPDGSSMRYLTWNSNQQVRLSQSTFEINEP